MAGLQGSTLSGHRMTTGFSSFELLTCGPLQKGRGHSPPEARFEQGAQEQYFYYPVEKMQISIAYKMSSLPHEENSSSCNVLFDI